ncbi:MAG TPA: YbhB/YbcL family Raf kinase inhibitor-like protein [Labilithrix sp.]|jgi:Raf kinase inhibitor-like YbhB/YbcL family protein|nr:YbhB/YbcL family Raf kinase inhibitor-like protein [Labilithrix sp.]
MRTRFFIDAMAAPLLFVTTFAACNPSTSKPATSSSTAPDGGLDSASPDDAATGTPDASTPVEASTDVGTITLLSTAFTNDGTIPVVHSVCDGANESIPLTWSGAPAEAKSFAIVMRDLTLGGSSNYHWVLYDIPTSITSLEQGVPKDLAPDPPGNGAKQTRWSFGSEVGYQGMCPIKGPSTHLYELSVYALDVATLPAPTDAADPAQVDTNIQAHQIAQGRLRGTYTKK